MDYTGPQIREMRVMAPHFRMTRELPRDILPILAIDPGGTTGWSLLVLRKKWCGDKDIFSWPFDVIIKHKLIWEHGELNCRDYENEGSYQIGKLIDNWPSAVVVIEDFILRSDRREKTRDLLSPVRITAKIESHLWTKGRKVLLQSPSQAKSAITDDRLRYWGFYNSKGGLVHARDADRHALLFLRRCMGANGLGLRTTAWPHIYMPLGKIEG